MKAFLLALEIAPMQVRRVYPEGLPLHCTVHHWFRTNAGSDVVLEKAASVIQTTPPIELIAGEEAWFGPSEGLQNILVNLIRPTEQLRSLHRKLYEAMGTLSVEHTEPSYIGDGFQPHVTRQTGGQFVEGSRHTSAATYLIEAFDPVTITDKFVVERIPHRK